MPAPVTLRVYHGSPHEFDGFDIARVGRGHDQEGPGLYFTTDEKDARSYLASSGVGMLLAADLRLGRTVSTREPATTGELAAVLNQAPNLAERLRDWDDDPVTARRMALATLAEQPTAHDAFTALCADFYRDTPDRYLAVLRSMEYDGVILERAGDVRHMVVFNPECVTIRERWRVTPAGDAPLPVTSPEHRPAANHAVPLPRRRITAQ